MATDICVVISGPALSFLLYENANSYGDQEGLLLGKVVNRVTETISDDQIYDHEMETFVSINSIVPFPSNACFYTGIGKLTPELKVFMEGMTKDIVGWYSFRRNVPLKPSLRSRIFHKELSSVLTHVPQEHFAMCLLSTTISKTGSTHTFAHKFLRYCRRNFEPMPMKIHNLDETRSEYKTVESSMCLSDSFNNIVASLGASQESVSDVELVLGVQETLQNHLRKLIDAVAASELEVAELEKEVSLLRETHSLGDKPALSQDGQGDVDNSAPVIVTPEVSPDPTTLRSSIEQSASSIPTTDKLSDTEVITNRGGENLVTKNDNKEQSLLEPEKQIQVEQLSTNKRGTQKFSRAAVRNFGNRGKIVEDKSMPSSPGNLSELMEDGANFSGRVMSNRENRANIAGGRGTFSSPGGERRPASSSFIAPSPAGNLPVPSGSRGKRRGSYARAVKQPTDASTEAASETPASKEY